MEIRPLAISPNPVRFLAGSFDDNGAGSVDDAFAQLNSAAAVSYSQDTYNYDVDIESHSRPSPFIISKGLITGCFASGCTRTDKLSYCAACRVVSYCCRQHQIASWPHHKTFCNPVKKAQAKLDEEEATLRAHPGNLMMKANPFESCVGHFWGTLDTRDYMRARYGVVDAILKINTREAVKVALDHILDMMRLCRSDNMGLRNIAPALFLRLGRDQEMYDFCKWCHGSFWDDVDEPFLGLKGEDVFEPVEPFVGKWPSLSYAIAVTLLKIRLLVDLQTLQRTKTEAGPHVPQEILATIIQHSVSPIIQSNRDIVSGEDQQPRLDELKKQVKQLFDRIDEMNRYIWPAMLQPGNNLTARPSCTGVGTPREMQRLLHDNYNSWVETPGAIGAVEELMKHKSGPPAWSTCY